MVAEISKRVTENIIEYLDEKEETTNKEKEESCSDIWLISEDTMVCKPCLMYANCQDRPLKYAKFYKAKFGTFDIR